MIVGLLIYWQIVDEFMIVTETVAVGLLSISFICKIYNLIKVQYVIFVLLLVLLFNLIGFSYTTTNGDVSTTNYTSKIAFIGINPLVFIILGCFLISNRKEFSKSINTLFYGSINEQIENAGKGISFYYKKFNEYNDSDLRDLFNRYKDYPKEAQIALLQRKKERSITI